MRKYFISFLLILFALSCTRVPVTNRRQMNLLAESDLMKMSVTEYNKFLAQHPPLPDTDRNTQLVKKVGDDIKMAVEKFMNVNKKHKKRIAGYKWQFNLVDDKNVNAWCMPGGKVVVYTGLLPVTQNETALAVVMGHEIAHAIAPSRAGRSDIFRTTRCGVSSACPKKTPTRSVCRMPGSGSSTRSSPSITSSTGFSM